MAIYLAALRLGKYPSLFTSTLVKKSETGGLDYDLHLKETARLMLTADIYISNRLINGQILKGYQ